MKQVRKNSTIGISASARLLRRAYSLRLLFPRRFLSRTYLYWNENWLFNIRRLRHEPLKLDFAVIGAGKSGTTSLYHALDRHPHIFMSKPEKEPHYFLDDQRLEAFWRRRGRRIKSRDVLLSHLMLKGFNGQRCFGEASTGYTAEKTANTSIPSLMYSRNPNIKLLYLLRNPHQRIVSHFKQDLKNKRVGGAAFEQDMNEQLNSYMMRSLYFFQLNNYLQVFPPEQTKVVILEELLRDPSRYLNEIFTFLGLEGLDGTDFPELNLSKTDADDGLEHQYQKLFHHRVQEHIVRDVEDLENFLGRKLDCWDLHHPFDQAPSPLSS